VAVEVPVLALRRRTEPAHEFEHRKIRDLVLLSVGEGDRQRLRTIVTERADCRAGDEETDGAALGERAAPSPSATSRKAIGSSLSLSPASTGGGSALPLAVSLDQRVKFPACNLVPLRH